MTQECTGDKSRFNLPSPCLVHALQQYLSMRKKRFGNARLKGKWPSLVTNEGEPLRRRVFNNFLKTAIVKLSRKVQIHLNRSEYTSHALRHGFATGMARLGYPSRLNRKIGALGCKELGKGIYEFRSYRFSKIEE